MPKKRVLVVDDNTDILAVFREGLEMRDYEVVTASGVNQALQLITTEEFDALLSDLHMPDAGDGLTVVSAMRHAHPKAVTLLLSGYPALQEAMAAVLRAADEVLVKPVGFSQISEIIEKKLADPAPRSPLKKERVAAILERDKDLTIQNWLSKVDSNEELKAIDLTYKERTGHLPALLGDLVRRLLLPPHSKVPISDAAYHHGVLRRDQSYTLAMIVEESRILQLSIFDTLQSNLHTVDFSTVLLDLMTIADEVDLQLKQAMLGYMQPAPAPAMATR